MSKIPKEFQPTKEFLKQWRAERKEEERFERAYGRFMLVWADAEAELYGVLVAYAKVSDEVARAMFSGARARIMMEHVRRIAQNTGMAQDRVDDLEHVFAQIAAINTARDHIAHYASLGYRYSDNEPGTRLVTNAKRAVRIEDQRIFPISPQTLEHMTWDLHGIMNHLNVHVRTVGESGPFRPWRENQEDPSPTPWLYKSPQPAGKRDRSPSNARKPKRQPKPSRAKP